MSQLTPKELVQRAMARGEIRVEAPPPEAPSRKQAPRRLTEQEILERCAERERRLAEANARRSAAIKAWWTPERRAAHSVRLRGTRRAA